MTVPCRARGLHRLFRDERRRLRQRAEDAAGVEPARAEAAEDLVPVDVARRELRDGGVPAIGAAKRGADAEAALGEVEPLRTVRPTPSYLTHVTRCSTPPWNIRSSTRRPTGLSASAVTMAVSSPKQRRSPRATLYSPPPSQTWNERVVWTRMSPGSSRSMTSPRATQSQRHRLGRSSVSGHRAWLTG